MRKSKFPLAENHVTEWIRNRTPLSLISRLSSPSSIYFVRTKKRQGNFTLMPNFKDMWHERCEYYSPVSPEFRVHGWIRPTHYPQYETTRRPRLVGSLGKYNMSALKIYIFTLCTEDPKLPKADRQSKSTFLLYVCPVTI